MNTIQFTPTMQVVYSIIAGITLIAAYISGYSRASRKYQDDREKAFDRAARYKMEKDELVEQARHLQKEKVERFSKYTALQQEHEEHTQRMISIQEMFSKQRDQWADKYEKLQQEIECHIHEVHKEVERPHIVYTNIPDEQYPGQVSIDPVGWKQYMSNKNSHINKGYREWREEHDEKEFLQSIYGKYDEWGSTRRDYMDDDIHD